MCVWSLLISGAVIASVVSGVGVLWDNRQVRRHINYHSTLKVLKGQRHMQGCGGEARDSKKMVPFKGAICKTRWHDSAEVVNSFACLILGSFHSQQLDDKHLQWGSVRWFTAEFRPCRSKMEDFEDKTQILERVELCQTWTGTQTGTLSLK